MWNALTQFFNERFYRGLAFFLPPTSRPLSRNPRSILIFSSTGIGDALADSAAIKSLKLAYPEAKVMVCSHHRRRSVAEHHAFIDEVIPLSKSPCSQARLLRRFWKNRPDLIVALHLNSEAVPLGYLLNRHAFVGSVKECQRMAFLLSHPVTTFQERHMVKASLLVADAAGGVPVEGMTYQVKPEEIVALHKRYSLLEEKPYLVFQTGGGKTLSWRDWPVASYIKAITWLREHYPHEIVLTGGHDNSAVGTAIANACPYVINCVNQTSLEETAALLHGATLLVSSDTGVMHLGFAISCPTLAILHYRSAAVYCGALDYSPGHEVVELPKPLTPPANHEGEMEAIPFDQVTAALTKMLARATSKARCPSQNDSYIQ